MPIGSSCRTTSSAVARCPRARSAHGGRKIRDPLVEVLRAVRACIRFHLLAQIAFQQLVVGRRQIAVLVQVADDVFGRLPHCGREAQRTQLPEEVVGQRGGRREEILNRGFLDLLVVVRRAETGIQIILEIGPKVDLVEGVFLFGLGFGDRLGFDRPVAILFCAGDVVEEGNGLVHLLQNRVLGDLRLDHLLQLQLVQRQNADHLHQSRRQNLALRDLETEFWLKKYHNPLRKGPLPRVYIRAPEAAQQFVCRYRISLVPKVIWEQPDYPREKPSPR